MVQHWMQWCRLCAREDPSNSHINVFLKDEEGLKLSDTINRFFSIDINDINRLPNMICAQCYNFIKTTMDLTHRISQVTAMFEELLVMKEKELDIKKMKALHNLESDFEFLSPTKQAIECEAKDILSEIAEQVIDEDLMNYKNSEPNPLNIKMEGDYDHLSSHYHESSKSTSDKAKEKDTLTIKRKYKSRKERWAESRTKPYFCSECPNGFMKFHNYRRHMQTVHSITIEYKTPNFICENCGKNFKSISALKEHEFSHSEERTLKCRHCEKTFKSNPSLKMHEDTHNETNYICVVCGLQLNTQRTLRMHMVVHSDQKKHKCDYCGNCYKRSKALKNHLILHIGLKPYTCDFCDKTFANGANCRSHKKKHHPVELAAQEAAGQHNISNRIIPKLNELKAVTANKADIVPQNNRGRLSVKAPVQN